MFIRNGQALGSILHKDEPRAARPKPKQTFKKAAPAKKAADVKEPEVKDEGVGFDGGGLSAS